MRRTRVTVGYLSEQTSMSIAEEEVEEEGGGQRKRRNLPRVIDLSGVELDLDDLATLGREVSEG